MINIRKADKTDIPLIHSMQVEAFSPHLKKYRDYETNPAAESIEKIAVRMDMPYTSYFLIYADGKPVGALRAHRIEKNRYRIAPVFIIPESQGKGIGSKAMLLLETLIPEAEIWELEAILEEEKSCRFYERLGYKTTGRTEILKKNMTLVTYEKHTETKNRGSL